MNTSDELVIKLQPADGLELHLLAAQGQTQSVSLTDGPQTGPRPYAAGTWGPAAASALVARDGIAWPEEL